MRRRNVLKGMAAAVLGAGTSPTIECDRCKFCWTPFTPERRVITGKVVFIFGKRCQCLHVRRKRMLARIRDEQTVLVATMLAAMPPPEAYLSANRA